MKGVHLKFDQWSMQWKIYSIPHLQLKKTLPPNISTFPKYPQQICSTNLTPFELESKIHIEPWMYSLENPLPVHPDRQHCFFGLRSLRCIHLLMHTQCRCIWTRNSFRKLKLKKNVRPYLHYIFAYWNNFKQKAKVNSTIHKIRTKHKHCIR